MVAGLDLIEETCVPIVSLTAFTGAFEVHACVVYAATAVAAQGSLASEANISKATAGSNVALHRTVIA
jgi:hypothetical protein